jgi:Holliday junction resolvase-like predicted endonuclease
MRPALRLRRRRLRGLLGELLGSLLARASGWEVVGRGLTIGGTQVDLVLRRGGLDVLLEVKARGPGRAASELSWLVSAAQRRRLSRAARVWAATGGRRQVVRVDVLELGLGWGAPRVRWYRSAIAAGRPPP